MKLGPELERGEDLPSFPKLRMRRLRRTRALRELLSEHRLTPSSLIYPLFVEEGIERPKALEALPGQVRWPLGQVAETIGRCLELGLRAFILFGVPKMKDSQGSGAYADDGVVQRALREVRRELGEEVVLITDVCLCEYTDHGHCGLVKEGTILNDETLELLKKAALSHAQAGADIVAPSAMMDGQVKAIREALDDASFKEVAIMAYSAKHASCFYYPFREAASSAPSFGDRRSYQMPITNRREALMEMELDVKEGADILMVKPALAYLDVIREARVHFNLPLAAYNVSGEYSMVKAASERGWIREEEAVLEILLSIKRAGADLILSYHAPDVATWIKEAGYAQSV